MLVENFKTKKHRGNHAPQLFLAKTANIPHFCLPNSTTFH